MRWLRARNLDVDKAEEMLQASMEWREKEDIKGLATWASPDIVKNDFLYKFTGEDAEGRPVLVVPFGRWEVRKLIEMGHKEVCFKHMYRLLEDMMFEINKRSDKKVTQFVVILDSAELTFRKIAHLETVQSVVQFFREFEANYPETLFACHIINAPWVFPYIFNIVKPLLSMRTLSKVQIYDSGAKWKDVLKAALPAKSYPQSYGGQAVEFF